MKFDIQFNQGAARWPIIRDAVLAAESMGYENTWVLDHLSSFGRADVSMLECFTTLGALAESTSTIGLGSLVANAQLRNPSVLAASATSVQNISSGRFTLGVGAGAAPGGRWGGELSSIGIDPPADLEDRHKILRNAISTCRAHWDGAIGDMPRPVSTPPIVVGVNSAELASVACETAEGINVRADHPRLEEITSIASTARAKVPTWSTSVWTPWSADLLLPGNYQVSHWRRMDIDRIVLVWFGAPDPTAILNAGRVNQ